MMWLGLALDPYCNFKENELAGNYCSIGCSGDKLEFRLINFRWNAYLIGVNYD